MKNVPASTFAARALELVVQASTDPTFARNKLERALGFARAVPMFRHCETGSRICSTGKVVVRNGGRIVLGNQVTFSGGMVPTELVSEPGGLIEIGDKSGFNYGVSLQAAERISIGQRCMVASFVRISDRSGPRAGPVVIGDDVWIAHGAIVEPGVTIGAGSVVAAGAVVSRDVPAKMMAIGNPARCVALELTARKSTP